jgi:hypothetical protein
MQKKKPTTSGTLLRDRLSYLWLALAILFFAFANVRWTIPLAAWLVPIFLLRFGLRRTLCGAWIKPCVGRASEAEQSEPAHTSAFSGILGA